MPDTALPKLIESGDGTVVVMSSTAGFVAYEGGGGYVAAKHGAHAIAATLRLELSGQPVRVIEIAPGMVRTDEFALNRFHGDMDKAAAVYAGVAHPLTGEDIADAVTWAVTRPSHVNVDLMVLRPRAQALHRRDGDRVVAGGCYPPGAHVGDEAAQVPRVSLPIAEGFHASE